MRLGGIAAAVFGLILIPAQAPAQPQPPSETLTIRGTRAATWIDGASNIVQIDGPVTIRTDQAQMTSQRAVIWLTPAPAAGPDQQRAEIALLGDARLVQGPVERSGARLYVTLNVRGSIRIIANQRIGANLSESDAYREALLLRPREPAAPGEAQQPPQLPIQRPWIPPPPATAPSTAPSIRPNVRATQPVSFRANDVQTSTTPEETLAMVLSGNVVLLQTRPNGDFVELQADRAVLFTPLRSLRELGEGRQFQRVEEAVTAAYLEGDVRINFTPAQARRPEQRLAAQRVYYEFTTDRAVLTDAVIHTLEPQRQIPIVLRAATVRQLSLGEYRADNVELSTSAFATPSYSVAADRAYVRSYDTNDPRYGYRTDFRARNATLELFHVPFFYLPTASGSMTERGSPLRQISLETNNRFGPSIRTDWGLFETLGLLPPQGLDVGYELDYLGKRGPAFGLNGSYRGGFVTETTKDPWNFLGEFDSYFVVDHGEDRLGRNRLIVQPEDDFRGQALWQHQHFFPEGWQVQLRAGYVSDPTFLEEFFEDRFNEGLPQDVSAYLKRQRETEALTLLVQFQPNDLVTTADLLQEQFEVEHIPELGYHRIGDSFGRDRFTFFSDNTIGGVRFNPTRASLAEQGFRAGQSPGIPSLGTTGVDDSITWRGDFRQEIDYPVAAGQFKFVPYVLGRFIPYSDSPDSGSVNRLFAGAGMRMTTAFWKIDDTAESKLFDIHRVRHIIEPELHVFTSAQTEDRGDVFVYEEPVDAINDVTALQLALHQRWQTKRGGAGRWRSVDFFSLNVEANFFGNQPDDAELNPVGFRGLFFPSLPEASIPRNSINADALWRVSDTTAILADQQYNLDQMELATASIGVAIQRDTRLNYFVGARYIGQINSTIASLAINYELSSKYSLQLAESVNLADRQNQDTTFTVIRRFDRFALTASIYYDAVDDVSGFRFGLIPYGLSTTISTDQLNTIFGPQ